MTVYRLSRLYEKLSERSALIMLAAWRGSTMAVTRAQSIGPLLYDDELIARAGPRPSAPGRRSPAPDIYHARQFSVPREGSGEALSPRQIEKMPPCPILGLDDPGVRIEPDFLGQRSSTEASGTGCGDVGGKDALDRPAVVIDRLRRRHVQHGIAVEQRDLDEDGAGLFGTPPAHRTEYALGLATAQISRNPDAGFQSHVTEDRPAANSTLVDG